MGVKPPESTPERVSRAAPTVLIVGAPDDVRADIARIMDARGLRVLYASAEAAVTHLLDALVAGRAAEVKGVRPSGEETLQLQGESHAPSLARAEWEYIHHVLASCGGNVSLAARLLGIHRRSLQRKLRKLPPNAHG